MVLSETWQAASASCEPNRVTAKRARRKKRVHLVRHPLLLDLLISRPALKKLHFLSGSLLMQYTSTHRRSNRGRKSMSISGPHRLLARSRRQTPFVLLLQKQAVAPLASTRRCGFSRRYSSSYGGIGIDFRARQQQQQQKYRGFAAAASATSNPIKEKITGSLIEARVSVVLRVFFVMSMEGMA